MQESIFTNYEQLPLFLNANLAAQTLGVSISTTYVALRVGNRIWRPKKSSASGWSSRSEVSIDVPVLAKT